MSQIPLSYQEKRRTTACHFSWYRIRVSFTFCTVFHLLPPAALIHAQTRLPTPVRVMDSTWSIFPLRCTHGPRLLLKHQLSNNAAESSAIDTAKARDTTLKATKLILKSVPVGHAEHLCRQLFRSMSQSFITSSIVGLSLVSCAAAALAVVTVP